MSEAQFERLRADLEATTRLAPGEPAVIAAQATWNCLHEGYDLALQQFEAAMAAGLGDVDSDELCGVPDGDGCTTKRARCTNKPLRPIRGMSC